jgi:hypothetical protein
MSDSINESGFIEWLRELFVGADAESMFRWVIVAWLVLVAAMVVLDRLGAGLLGRSRPLEQAPPERARTWRWGRRTPPPTYSLLPTGTIDERAHQAPAIRESIPLSTRPLAALPAPSAAPILLANPDYWRAAANPAAPHFGYENTERLERGTAPERYNPVTGRVESLDRDESTGILIWPGDAEAPLAVGLLDDTEDDLTDTDLEADDELHEDTGDTEEPGEQDELEAEPADEQDEEPVDGDREDEPDDEDPDDSTDEEEDDAVELTDDEDVETNENEVEDDTVELSDDDTVELSDEDAVDDGEDAIDEDGVDDGEDAIDEDDAVDDGEDDEDDEESVERTEIEAGAE